MVTRNIHQAKTELSKLIEQALAGEDVVIAKAGKPVVKLVPVQAKRPIGELIGVWKGRVNIAPDFDELPEDIAAAFRGELP